MCDGNGFDEAYGCDGNPIPIKPEGATFQLPCNNAPTYTGGVECETIGSRTYYVFARALGKPGGSASMKTGACYLDYSDLTHPEGVLVCSLGVLELPLQRDKGRSMWQDATDELTSLYINDQTIPLFATGYEDFFWQYDNYGLRHAQIRLYPVIQ